MKRSKQSTSIPESVSGSNIYRAELCPSSIIPAEHPYNPPSENADLGSAGHACMENKLNGKEPDIVSLAKAYAVEPDEVSLRYRCGMNAWKAIQKFLPNPKTEIFVRGPVTFGRMDVLDADKHLASIVDWDFGHAQFPKERQLLGYADAVREEYGMPESGHITCYDVKCLDGTFTVHRFDEDELDAFREKLRGCLKRAGKEYGPSPRACMFCKRQLECGACVKYLRLAASWLIKDEQGLLVADKNGAALSDEAYQNTYPKWQMLKKISERFDGLLKQRLKEGPLSLGNGRRLELREHCKQTIDVRKAWPVMADELSAEDINAALSVSKKKLIDAVRKNAKRGHKKSVAEAFLERLSDVDAITESTYTRRYEVDED